MRACGYGYFIYRFDKQTSGIGRHGGASRRLGPRIQNVVKQAVKVALRQKRLLEEAGFLLAPRSEPIGRDRSCEKSPTLRKPEMIHPTETRLALVDLVSQNFGATEGQAVVATSRAFAFKSTAASCARSAWMRSSPPCPAVSWCGRTR